MNEKETRGATRDEFSSSSSAASTRSGESRRSLGVFESNGVNIEGEELEDSHFITGRYERRSDDDQSRRRDRMASKDLGISGSVLGRDRKAVHNIGYGTVEKQWHHRVAQSSSIGGSNDGGIWLRPIKNHRRLSFDAGLLSRTSFAFEKQDQVRIPDFLTVDEIEVAQNIDSTAVLGESQQLLYSEEGQDSSLRLPKEEEMPILGRSIGSKLSTCPTAIANLFGRLRRYLVRHWRLLVAYSGPGWLMSVAYLDPGNIESDLQAGGYTGYQLLWVLAFATLLGFFFQALAARLGVVTGKHLSENCREYYDRKDSLFLYLMIQLAIIGSDIQEIVGSAVAFRVLFGFPLWVGCLLTGLDTLTFLCLKMIGVRRLEIFFFLLILCMFICFVGTFSSTASNPHQILEGFVTLNLPKHAIVQAVSILGAVVMPHNIYLHSALVLSRDIDRARSTKVAEANRYFCIEAALALFVSLLINWAVVGLFAHGFYSPICEAIQKPLTLYPSGVIVAPPFACVPEDTANSYTDELLKSNVVCVTSGGSDGTCMPIGLQLAPSALEMFIGKFASIVWAIGLLAAGQSSTMTGTYAGQFVLEGFFQLSIPNWIRVALTRAVSLVPATIVAVLANTNYLAADRLGEGLNVLQSLQLPFALLPLLTFTGKESMMGDFTSSRLMRHAGWGATILVLLINAFLVYESVDVRSMSFQGSVIVFGLALLYIIPMVRLVSYCFRVNASVEQKKSLRQEFHTPVFDS